jgi:hypothetical protein
VTGVGVKQSLGVVNYGLALHIALQYWKDCRIDLFFVAIPVFYYLQVVNSATVPKSGPKMYGLCMLLNYNFMELSPSCEAASRSAVQELRNILWNPNVHYLIQKSPPLVPIQNQINTVRTTPSYLPNIYLGRFHGRSARCGEEKKFFASAWNRILAIHYVARPYTDRTIPSPENSLQTED